MPGSRPHPLTAALAVFLALGLAAPARGGTDWSGVDSQALRRLTARGPLVAVTELPNGKLDRATAAIFIDAPPDKVAAAMTDFAHYPEFMPQVEKAEVLDRTATSALVAYTLKFEVGIFSKRIRYRTRYEFPSPHEASYRLVEGDFARNEGGWSLRPVGDGNQTILFYSNFTDLSRLGPVVGALLKQPSMEMAIATSGVAVLVKTVKKRAEGG